MPIGLATALIRFFSDYNRERIDGKHAFYSVTDFCRSHPRFSNLTEVNIVCEKLYQKGFLADTNISRNRTYISKIDPNIDYGIYDFIVNGFAYIRDHFVNSVLPLVGVNHEGNQDNGSAFFVEGFGFVTNAHCVRNMKSKYIGWNPQELQVREAFVPVDERLDLALIPLDSSQLQGTPAFRLRPPQMLEEVLTMGYPPIPGFDGILISERAHIAGYLKSSVGQVLGQSECYLDRQQYLLISARVKGGNSGGPVICEDGRVVGIVAQQPSISFDGSPDSLGYGVVIPADVLAQFLQDYQDGKDSIQRLSFPE